MAADLDLNHPPDGVASPRAGALARSARVDDWIAMQRSFAFVLTPADPPATWLGRFARAADRVRELTSQDPDTALYMMLQAASDDWAQYSANHALFCGVVADLCAAQSGSPDDEAAALVNAALTMNIGMREVQDALAQQGGALSVAQRQLIEDHPQVAVDLLKAAGVTDTLWLDIVKRHHRPVADGETSDPSSASQRLAHLLHRIDVFTAKLSKRKTRPGSSASAAARDACLDASGRPDETGTILLRVLGLYPPGSFVRLANGEIGVVVRRGAKAHTPQVACVRSIDGSSIATPLLRETSSADHAIKRSLSADDVRMRLAHAKVVGALP